MYALLLMNVCTYRWNIACRCLWQG